MIGRTISHYTILEKLGEGGMGEVYLAEDSKLERKVALKFLPLHYTKDVEVNARFQREAKAAAKLNHPNIITVYEIGEHEGRAFIAMEYIDGQSLREVIETNLAKVQNLRKVIDILSQICEGLAKAHQAGIVHRDLKPENIMLDADGKVRILDFGLARMKGKSRLTSERSTLGTLSYISPEHFEGMKIDHRADIWAVGVMLYEMITGKLPFEGEYEQAVIYSIVNEEPEPLARYKTGVSPDLQCIVDKALDKDRETRYQNITDLLTDLKRGKKSSVISKKSIRSAKSRKTKHAVLRYAAMAAVIVIAVVAGMFVFKPPSAPKIPATHKQVTFTGDANFPSISPDGQFVAYARGTFGDQILMVEDLASGQTLKISPRNNFYASLHWLPNGAELSYWGAIDSASFGTQVVPRLGGNARQTTVKANSAWSPDGAYSASANTNWSGIYLISAATDRFVTHIPIKGSFHFLYAIEWSPLSNRLIILTKGDTQHMIRTIKIDGSEQQKVVEDANLISSPRWAANGQAIYYFRTVGRTKQLMKVEISTKTGKAESEPEILQSGMEAGEIFSISRDNKRLFYTRELRYSNLWRVDLQEEAARQSIRPKQLTTGTLANFAPSISPDGKKIAFSVAKGEQANIFVMPVEGGQLQQLTYMDAYNASPVWSPGGQEIAFASWQDDDTKVWKMSAAGGNPQPFNESKLNNSRLELTWSPGRHILYQRPDLRNFYNLNPDTKTETPLVDNASVGWIHAALCSPDGRSVAIFRTMQFDTQQSGLWVISIEDSSQKLLHKSFSILPFSWSKDSHLIYALSTDNTPNKILKIPANGDAAIPVFTLPVDEIDGITMTPDGKQFVYAAVEKKSDVWIMEHFDPENELEEPFEPPDSPEFKLLAYWEDANNLNREKKYAEAEKVYREGLELNPDHTGLLHDFGWSFNNQKKYHEAEELFREGIARYPEDSKFFNGLGWSLNWQRKYAEAEEVFRDGLEFSPKHRALLNGIRRAALENKNYEAAKRYNEEYLAQGASPNTRRAVHASLGAIGILLMDYHYAERHFRNALAIDSTNSQALRGLGYLFAVQNRYAEAATYAFRALKLDSSFANDHLTAWVLVAGEIDIERGIRFAEQALASKPENWAQIADVYSYYALPEHTLGLAYLKKGEVEKAVKYLEQAADFAPERQAIREDLRMAKQKLTQK